MSSFINLFPDLKSIELFETKSSGYSFKYKAIKQESKESDEVEVIVKLSFEPTSQAMNNNIVEGQIYEHVLTKLAHNTPNLPKFFGVKNFLDTKITKSDMSEIESWDSHDLNIRSVQALVIENVGEHSLLSLLHDEHTNPHITFQILYTIACFERVGLKHNDLHPGNISIKIYDQEQQLNYKIGEKLVSFKTTKIVKIIDYDRSCIYHKDVERNGYLDFFQSDQYNGINTGQDTFKYLKLYYYVAGSPLKSWLELLCPKIFTSEYEDGFLPQNINPMTKIPDTLTILESLVEHFKDHFIVSKKDYSDCLIWRLPEETSIKPMSPEKFTFTAFRAIFTSSPKLPHAYNTELCLLNYDWKLQHFKLFEKVKSMPYEETSIYNACIRVTNPLRYDNYNKLETLIALERDILVKSGDLNIIHIPQKYRYYEQ